MCLPRVIDKPMPKKIAAKLGRLHALRRNRSIARASARSAAILTSSVTVLILDQRPQDRDQLKIFAGPDLQKDVRRFDTIFVSRMSTKTIVRSLRPLGRNLLFCISVYLVK